MDDAFDADTQSLIYQLMQRPKWAFKGGRRWRYGADGRLTSDSVTEPRFWHMDGLEEEAFFNVTLFDLIRARLGRVLRPVTIMRVYANGYTAAQRGTPHNDESDVTVLYFASPRWQPDWNGSLLFLDANNTPVRQVEYRPNRLVAFPGNTRHCGDAPSPWYPGLRISLAYKLRVIDHGGT